MKTQTYIISLLLALSHGVSMAQPAPRSDSEGAWHAADYVEALERAKATGSDIVVLQRGSDWCVLGERIYNNLWSQETFAKELGQGFVLTTVDRPDSIGDWPLFDPRSGSVPPLTLLARMTGIGASIPANEITAVSSAQEVAYARRADGAFSVPAWEKKNPDKDTLTATMRTRAGGPLLRLDFPIDSNNKDFNPGRAINGNFVISEVEVSVNGQPVKIDAAWGNDEAAQATAEMAVDGISDKAGNGWNARGDLHRTRTLLLALATPCACRRADRGETRPLLLVRPSTSPSPFPPPSSTDE